MQSRKISFLESMVNTIVGTVIGFCIVFFVSPLVGLSPTFEQSLWLNVFFVVASTVRSYSVRRGFIWYEKEFTGKDKIKSFDFEDDGGEVSCHCK